MVLGMVIWPLLVTDVICIVFALGDLKNKHSRNLGLAKPYNYKQI